MEIDVRQLVRTMLRYWWIPVVTVLTFTLAGVGVGSMLPKEYLATTQLLVPPKQNPVSAISDGSPISTYKNLLTSGPILDRVILELGLDLNREQLANKVSVTVLGGTQIIEVSVSDSDPEVAADLTNSLARNFEAQVIDLTSGEFQRNLDNLRAQSDGAQTQITVLDSRIGELDTPENADDTVTQVEISKLERERLQLAQKKTDIDAAIRSLSSQISMAGAPIVVLEVAQVPEYPEASSTAVLILFGAFLGGLLGLVILLFLGFWDKVVRNESSIVSQPVLAKSGSAGLSGGAAMMLATRLGLARGEREGDVLLVAPRKSASPAKLASSMSTATGAAGTTAFSAVEDLLDDAAGIARAASSAGVAVVADLNRTSISDLEEVDTLLRSLNVPILGTIVLK